MKKLSLFVLTVAILASCTQKEPAKKISKVKYDNNRMIYATLFVQHAAEFKALTYQAYNIAKYRLSEAVKNNKAKKKLAVVLDIDETVLDNSPQFGTQIRDTTEYPKCWDEWVKLAQAEPVAGAPSFLKLADSLGVKIFYVSNRKNYLLDPTIKNLRNKKLPQVDSSSVLLRTGKRSKEPRRQSIISQGYEIALLLGDNLGDFSEVFDVRSCDERGKIVKQNNQDFGDKFIILPNPVYGTWLGNLGFFKRGINPDSLAITLLKTFECKK